MPSHSNDLKKLFSDTALITLAKILTTAIGFITHTILVRNLKPDLFGVFSLALTVISVTAGLAAFGMNKTVARFIAADDDEVNQYIVIGISVVFLTGCLFAVGLFFADEALETFFSSDGLAGFLQVLAVLVLLRPFSSVIVGVVRGFEKTRWKVLSNDLLPSIISMGVFFYFVFRGEILLGAILLYVLRPPLKILFLTFHFFRWDEWSFGPVIPDRTNVSKTFSFTWPLAFQGLVTLLMSNIDILMLGRLSGSIEVGYYRSIQPVSQILLFLLSSLTFIYLPIATRYYTGNDHERLDSLYKTVTRWVAHATFPLFLFYLLFGREFIRVFFTEEYTAAWLALLLLSIGMYSRVFVGPNGMTIEAINRTREELFASLSSLITNIVLNLLLVPRYGIEGAAIATTLSFFVFNAIELGIIYKYAGISPFHWDLATPILPTTFITLVFTLVLDLQTPSPPVLFLIGLGICIIHLVSITLIVGLRPEDRLLLDQLLDR